MKKLIIGLCFLAIACPAMADSSASCGGLDKIREKARQNMEDMSQQVHGEMVKEKEGSFWDDCVGGILDGGSSFGLSMPSMGSILNKACSYARDSAESQLQQATQNFSYDFGYGVGVDAGATATGGGGFGAVEVTDSSKSLADSVWDALK